MSNSSIIDDKARSKSRPRLSKSEALETDDADSFQSKKRKSELITINRAKLEKKRSSMDGPHVRFKKQNKRKSLHNIKENKEAKPSSKKKMFGRKYFKTKIPSLETKNLDKKDGKGRRKKSSTDEYSPPKYTKSAKSLDVMQRINAKYNNTNNNNNDIDVNITDSDDTSTSLSASSKRKAHKMKGLHKRSKTKNSVKEYASLTKDLYEDLIPDKNLSRRSSVRLKEPLNIDDDNYNHARNKNNRRPKGRKYGHKYSGSQGICLSTANEAIKKRSKSVKRLSLGNTLSGHNRKVLIDYNKPRSCTNNEVKRRTKNKNKNKRHTRVSFYGDDGKNKKRQRNKGRINKFAKNEQRTITGKYNTFNK